MSQRKGLLFIFIAALLFSIGGLCIKMIPWNSLSINSFRSMISSVMLFAFAKITHQELRMTPGVLIGACAMCVTTTLYAAANKLTTAANTILIQFTAPVFIILFMWLIFKEKPKKLDVITCIFVFGGIACFFMDSLGNGRALGDFLALLSGVGYAWIFMMNKLPGANPLFSCMLGQAMGAVIGLPFLLQETEFTGTALLYATALGVFQLGFAYMFFSTGIRYAPPVSASLVSGIEPILNPVLVALVLGETLSGMSIVGGIVVFVSIMLYNVLSARREKALIEAD